MPKAELPASIITRTISTAVTPQLATRITQDRISMSGVRALVSRYTRTVATTLKKQNKQYVLTQLKPNSSDCTATGSMIKQIIASGARIIDSIRFDELRSNTISKGKPTNIPTLIGRKRASSNVAPAKFFVQAISIIQNVCYSYFC